MFAFPPAVPLSPTAATLVPQQYAAPQTTEVVAPVVVQRVSIQQTPSRSDLLVGTDQWSWVELKDYVAAEIVSRFGPFPRIAKKEYGIFSRFFSQYAQDGIAVARFAFGPVCDGWWGNAPISINRFCKASDPYFVQPILERLAGTA